MAKIIKKLKAIPVNTVYKMRINSFVPKSYSNYYREWYNLVTVLFILFRERIFQLYIRCELSVLRVLVFVI